MKIWFLGSNIKGVLALGLKLQSPLSVGRVYQKIGNAASVYPGFSSNQRGKNT